MTTLYDKASEAFSKADAKRDKHGHDSYQAGFYTGIATSIDQELGSKFKEPIQQWQDGLITATELYNKIRYEAEIERLS